LEMVKVGEQTGALADMLNAVADFYDDEMSGRVAAVMALAEPVMLVLMAFVVAGMLLSFYLPLFEAISGVRERVSWALAEPVMLVLMAFVVAGMLLSFYLPLFEAISSIQK